MSPNSRGWHLEALSKSFGQHVVNALSVLTRSYWAQCSLAGRLYLRTVSPSPEIIPFGAAEEAWKRWLGLGEETCLLDVFLPSAVDLLLC